MNRRKFLKSSAVAGVAAVSGRGLSAETVEENGAAGAKMMALTTMPVPIVPAELLPFDFRSALTMMREPSAAET